MQSTIVDSDYLRELVVQPPRSTRVLGRALHARDNLRELVVQPPRSTGSDGRAEVPPIDEFFASAKGTGKLILIPPEVRIRAGKDLEQEEQVLLQQTIKQGIQEGVIPKSRHLYTLRHEYKVLRRRILRSYRELDEHKAYLLALAIQENAKIATLDSSTIDALDRIRSKMCLPRAEMAAGTANDSHSV